MTPANWTNQSGVIDSFQIMSETFCGLDLQDMKPEEAVIALTI